jgi:hypothetical protein
MLENKLEIKKLSVKRTAWNKLQRFEIRKRRSFNFGGGSCVFGVAVQEVAQRK